MGKKLLLVEGTDDEHVVRHLCRRHHLNNLFDIENCDGIDRLRKNFPIWLKASDIDTIGVLVDANADIQARWKSLRCRLTSAGYRSVPEAPDEEGFISERPSASPSMASILLPRVGIWLMPNNSTNGTLEHFLRFLVPKSNTLLDHARDSIDSIPDEQRRFEDKDEMKVLLHTWLAWQKKPGKPYGTAITARYLNADVPEAANLVSWLKKLFG